MDNGFLVASVVRLKKCFLLSVEKHDKATLLPIIKQRIKEGTRIISDGWAAYKSLKTKAMTTMWLTTARLCRSYDPTTGAHTQTIESLWWQIKRQLPDTYSRHNQMHLHLAEYMWRQLDVTVMICL